MTSEPLPAECAEMRRRLAEGDTGREVNEHLAGCPGCSAFAATLAGLEARLAGLPLPEPPAGAADRAVARFRAELAHHGPPSTVPLGPPPASTPLMPDAAPLTASPSPSAGSAPPWQAPPTWRPHASQARRRRWRLPVSAGVAAAIALVVALVAVLGTASKPLAFAAFLRDAAVHTRAERSARFGLTGTIGLLVRGHRVGAAVSGAGTTESPDRGELTEVTSVFGRPLRQDVVSVGDRVWTRLNSGRWVLATIPPGHPSPIHQALAYPAQALDDLTRVGSGYRSLGPATVGGTRVRQIQLTIPGDSFHAFGELPERVSHWTVVVDVTQASLILRRLTITGHGAVRVEGVQVPFTYSLQLTLRDFGARVSIQPPGSGPSPRRAGG